MSLQVHTATAKVLYPLVVFLLPFFASSYVVLNGCGSTLACGQCPGSLRTLASDIGGDQPVDLAEPKTRTFAACEANLAPAFREEFGNSVAEGLR